MACFTRFGHVVVVLHVENTTGVNAKKYMHMTMRKAIRDRHGSGGGGSQHHRWRRHLRPHHHSWPPPVSSPASVLGLLSIPLQWEAPCSSRRPTSPPALALPASLPPFGPASALLPPPPTPPQRRSGRGDLPPPRHRSGSDGGTVRSDRAMRRPRCSDGSGGVRRTRRPPLQ
jgi:hypothetical protein